MNRTSAFSAVIVLGLTACDTLNRPITSGDYDPLRAPGSGSHLPTASSQFFSAGQFVRAAMNNTAFFKTRPKGEANADKLLTRGTSMKVISHADSYVKVELDSGEIGFVPAVMVENPNAAASVPTANPGEIQVYPPIGGGYGAPLPPVDPAGLPPEGAIPTVIDPEAPATTTPIPPVTPPTDTFPAPAAPKKEPVPLPPNGEEEKPEEKTGQVTPKLEN